MTVKISELTDVSPIETDDLIEIVRSGVSRSAKLGSAAGEDASFLGMTEDVLSADLTVPVGWSMVRPNFAVAAGVTATISGTLIVL